MKAIGIVAGIVIAGSAVIGLGYLISSGIVESDRAQSQAFVNHQKDVEAAIAAKKVIIGMTTEEVRKAWGKPRNIDRTSTANHEGQHWFYGEGTLLVFFDGKVHSITTSK